MRKKIILAGVVILAVTLLGLVSTYSFIEIIPESQAENISYSLVNSKKSTDHTFSSAKPTKRLVRKGQYELLAKKDDSSYFEVVKAKGFLSSTKSHVKLLQEKSRKFIGDNPSPCMYYVGQVLASSECEDLYSHLKLHLAATEKHASYTINSSGQIDGMVEGIITNQSGTLALLSSSTGSGHRIYNIQDDLSLVNPVALTDLNSNKSYHLQPHKDGFIVYDSEISQIFYYTSPSARPSSINIKRPSDNTKLLPYSLKTQGSNILVAYSDNSEDIALARGGEEEPTLKPTDKANVTLLVYGGGKAQEYGFNKRILTFMLCGTSKLCLLDRSGELGIYDVTGDKPKLLYSLGNVERIEALNNELLIVKKSGLLSLNADSRQGSIMYSFGSYNYCGMSNNSHKPTLCVTNVKGKNSAILIDPSTNNDGFDKKISKLLELPEIKSLSVYDKYIHISPELGSLIYDPKLRITTYDPAVKKKVNAKINLEIDKLGIDRKVYRVINPFEN